MFSERLLTVIFFLLPLFYTIDRALVYRLVPVARLQIVLLTQNVTNVLQRRRVLTTLRQRHVSRGPKLDIAFSHSLFAAPKHVHVDLASRHSSFMVLQPDFRPSFSS